jgi:hypothetical protein
MRLNKVHKRCMGSDFTICGQDIYSRRHPRLSADWKNVSCLNCIKSDKRLYYMEWLECGKWWRSRNIFKSRAQGLEHAQIIGAKTFRVKPIRQKKKRVN